MSHEDSWSLQIDFRHPGEAVMVISAVLAVYRKARPEADAAGIPELSAHFSRRIDDLGDCLAQAEFDLECDDAAPVGHA